MLLFKWFTLLSLWLVFVVCTLLTWAAWSNVIFIIMFVVPCSLILAVAFARFNSVQIVKCNPETFIQLFCLGFFPGSVVLLALEMMFTVSFAYLCFGKETKDMVHLIQDDLGGDANANIQQTLNSALTYTTPARGLLFILLSSFITAAFLEEAFKASVVYLPSFHLPVGDGTLQARSYSVLLCISAFSLGFASCESIGFTCISGSHIREKLSIAFGRLVFAVPMHLSCGCLTGIGLIKKHIKQPITWAGILLPGIMAHGSFDFQTFLFARARLSGALSPFMALCGSAIVSSVVMVLTVSYLKHSFDQLVTDLNLEYANVPLFTRQVYSLQTVQPMPSSATQLASQSAATLKDDYLDDSDGILLDDLQDEPTYRRKGVLIVV